MSQRNGGIFGRSHRDRGEKWVPTSQHLTSPVLLLWNAGPVDEATDHRAAPLAPSREAQVCEGGLAGNTCCLRSSSLLLPDEPGHTVRGGGGEWSQRLGDAGAQTPAHAAEGPGQSRASWSQEQAWALTADPPQLAALLVRTRSQLENQ